MQDLFAAFKRAAEIVKMRQSEKDMEVDERISMYIRQWCSDWQQDLEQRPEEVKESAAGRSSNQWL